MNSTRRLAAMIVVALVFSSVVHSADITVMNTNDSGAGSLRDAVANVPAGGSIDFDPALFNVARTISLTTVTIATTKSMSIIGPGADLLTISGNNTFTIFDTSDDNVSFSGLTITGGNGDTVTSDLNSLVSGGIVGFFGTMSLTNCVVTGNRGKFAGGIYSQGILIVTSSTLSNNMAVLPTGFFNNGGGISNDGTMTLTNCTISGNSATGAGDCGGGFENFNGNATVINCTITNNSSTGNGSAPGVRATQGTITVRNSIIAANVANTTDADVSTGSTASFISGGNNIIGNVGSVTAFNQASDQVGSGAAPLNPLLTTLGNFGGRTPTHLIGRNSPGLNAGLNAGAPAADQRGITRPVGVNVDIGAVEAAITVNPAAIATGQMGVGYTGATFTASGGTAAYSFNLTGALPTGMVFSSPTATLSGTPTQTGIFPIYVVATDANGIAGVTFYNLLIGNFPDLTAGLAHTGNFKQGQSGATFTATVSNAGPLATSATITATLSTFPADLTATSFTGSGWTQVSLSPPTATFSGAIASGASNAALVLTVNVAPDAATPLALVLTVSGGGEGDTTNDTASDSATILAADPIVISSGPTATPNVVDVGQTVTFSAGAGGGAGALTFTWDFGDGSPTATGTNVTHAYTVGGTFTVTLTITDKSTGSVSSTTTVTVNATPGGGSGTFQPLVLTKAQIRLNFTKITGDSVSIAGTLPIVAGFKPAGQPVTLDVGGVLTSFTLDAKASAKSGSSSFKLTVKAKKKVVLAQNAKFMATIKGVPLAEALAKAGVGNVDAKKAQVKATFTIVHQGIGYQKVQSLTYTAKKDKSGTAKKMKADN